MVMQEARASCGCASLEREPLVSEQGDTGVDGGGVIETPLAGFDLGQRGVEAQCGPIGKVRGDRLSDIGDGKNPRLDDNCLRGKAPWITRAVEPLMMLQYGLGNRPAKLEALNDVVASLWMGPDELHFERSQLAGLAEDLGRNIDLADVVDQPCEKDSANPILRQT